MKKNDEVCTLQTFSVILESNMSVSNKNTNQSSSNEYIRKHMVMANIDIENNLTITHEGQHTNSNLCTMNYIRNMMIFG